MTHNHQPHDDAERRLRAMLREPRPEPLDPAPIIAAARRRRTDRRTGFALAAVTVLVAGVGVVTIAPLVLRPQSVNSAPQAGGARSESDRNEARPAAPREPGASRESGTPGSAGASIALEDGLAVDPTADGFCVRNQKRERICHSGPGSVVVQGTQRRWLVFHGPLNTMGYMYRDGTGAWQKMDWRAASRVEKQAAAFAPDPVGEAPFRVRAQQTSPEVHWDG